MLYLFSVKISILLNGKPMEELSCICHASKAQQKVCYVSTKSKISLHMQAKNRVLKIIRLYFQGRHLVSRLKEELPRQQFAIAIQAAVGSTSKILGKLHIWQLSFIIVTSGFAPQKGTQGAWRKVDPSSYSILVFFKKYK